MGKRQGHPIKLSEKGKSGREGQRYARRSRQKGTKVFQKRIFGEPLNFQSKWVYTSQSKEKGSIGNNSQIPKITRTCALRVRSPVLNSFRNHDMLLSEETLSHTDPKAKTAATLPALNSFASINKLKMDGLIPSSLETPKLPQNFL